MARLSYHPWIAWASLLFLVLIMSGYVLASDEVDFSRALKAPTWLLPGGTDHFGRNLAIATWRASATSTWVAALTAIATMLVGGLLGLLASVNRLCERLATTAMLMSITLPSLFITLIIAGITDGGRLAVAIAVGLTHWPIAAQLIGQRLRMEWGSGWVRYDRQLGASLWQLTVWHLVPAIGGRAVLALGILFPAAIIHQATTAFLGIGTEPDAIALGPLIAWGRHDIANDAWWTLLVPSVALILLILPPLIMSRSQGLRTPQR